ncbi:tripartite tricarboxylate transporter TctB family protein [Fusibacter sp. JL216-2]|uniref:tripartite tricarboxylate transporter TctB family protein n=1 Tax=Fusibacter sp. JL216-2 TaxID=3071453 RepID=UPI003D32C339
MTTKSAKVESQKASFKPDYNALMGFVVAAFGLVYLIMTFNLKRSAIGDPLAPLYFPIGLGSMLVIFGIVQVIRSDIKKSIESIKQLKNASDQDKQINHMIAYTCVAGVVYALVFEHLGFVLSTLGFMLAMLMLTDRKAVVKNIIIAVLFSVGIYLLFTNALGIPLPKMPYVGF